MQQPRVFSPEYIDLCRKLALGREFQQGDWRDWIVPPDPNARYKRLPGPHCASSSPGNGKSGDMGSYGMFWLPLEGNWLDLLEAEGLAAIISLRPAKDGSGYGAETGEGDDGDFAFGATRLEALAHLYVAIVGIDLDG